MILRDVIECNAVRGYQRFIGTCCMRLQTRRSQDGDGRRLRNNETYLTNNMKSHPRIP
jgi:hypothetical protein